MRVYSNILQDMQRAILEADATGAEDFYPAKDNFSPQEQIGVYISAYRLRLSGVISRNFPASKDYLTNVAAAGGGGNKWEELVNAFVEATPSVDYSLDRYILRFPPWIEQNCTDGFARELVKLEGLVEEVYILPDSEALSPAWIAAQSAQELERIAFKPRTALRAEQFSFPLHQYLAEFRRHGSARKPEAQPQYLVICRHNNIVKRHMLSVEEFATFNAITAGDSLQEALKKLENDPSVNVEAIAAGLQSWFPRWVEWGLFCTPG